MRLDDPVLHFDNLLGDPFAEQDSELYRRGDPEAESVRSHPSSHAEQALLPSPTPIFASRPPTQRLQRRRDHQYYMNNGGPVPSTTTMASSHKPSPGSAGGGVGNSSQHATHHRAKSYSSSGHTSSWLLGGVSPFVDTKRNSWTGERREIRKLQKEHPVGSARPSFTVEISNDEDPSGSDGAGAAERDGVKGSVLGVRRKMGRLRGLYRRGEKDLEASSNLR